MADEEAEQERSERRDALNAFSARLDEIASPLKNSADSPDELTSQYCYDFCQTLVEFVSLFKIEEEPLTVLEVYIMALLSFTQMTSCFSAQSEKIPVVLERLSLSCVELLISLHQNVPDELWERFKSSVQTAHLSVQEKGISQLMILSTLSQEQGIWTNPTLQSILKNDTPAQEKVHEFLTLEGPTLLMVRVKHLIKENCIEQAALLAKACAEFSEFEEKGHFKQTYLVCLCTIAPQEIVMEELSRVDCRDALEMICNLEADGDEKAAFTLCSAFLTRQILQEDSYCAWELTLFWGKLLKRLESSEQGFLDKCRQMSLLSKTVFHLLFFVKVIQSEMDKDGLPSCIEMCIRALRMESCEGSTKATVCKTISCLLPSDLEVKRACQLTEFLQEPTVDAYYAVETLYNEPDQKLEEEHLPVPNSMRCDVLLVLKTQWPFDPEFWDWKTLKRHCLGLMGEEASIVSSIDELNDGDPEALEKDANLFGGEFKDVSQRFVDTTNELNEIADQKQKNREIKKLREKGFVSARFRNWQAYMQYCVLCDKEFLGHRIVRHAQTHFKDGHYVCPICLETFDVKESLEPHVASHVKLSCKERLAAMKTSQKLANPKTAAPVIAALKAKSGENQLRKAKTKNNFNGVSNKFFNGDAEDSERLDLKDSSEVSVCPVQSCRKGFKYFRNLLAHVKDHGDNEEAKRFLEMQTTKVVCQYCRRQFVSVDHLNDHLQMHCGTKPYICIQLNCKASFDSNAELVVHKKDHPVFKAKCMFPGCGKIFHEAYKLYDHEAQHYKTFTCKAPDCGKVFHCQAELDLHAESHITKVEGQSTDRQSTEEQSNQTNQPAPVLDTQLNENYPGPPSDRLSSTVLVKHSVENMLNGDLAISSEEFLHKQQDQNSVHKPHKENPVHKGNDQNPVHELHDQNSVHELHDQNSVHKLHDQNPVHKPNDQDSVHKLHDQNSVYKLHEQNPVHKPNDQDSVHKPNDQNPVHEPHDQNLIHKQHIQSPIHQQIPQTNDHLTQAPGSGHMSHLNQFGPEESLLETLMNDSDPMPSTSSYQSLLEDFLPVPAADVLRGQLSNPDSGKTPSYNNTNGAFGQYNPNPLGQIQKPYSNLYSNNTTPQTQSCHNATPLVSLGQMVPPVSQTLPIQIAPLQSNGQKSEIKGNVQAVGTNNALQVVTEKERHKCPHDTCTRDYSSYRSVTKHMKAVHPEFYAEWKLAKKNNAAPRSVSAKKRDGSIQRDQVGQKVPGPQTQKHLGQPNPYSTNCVNPGFPVTSVSAPTHLMQTNGMDKILGPIVTSQLGNDTNQSPLAPGHLWDPRKSALPQPQNNLNNLPNSHFTPHLSTASSDNSQNRGMHYITLQSKNNPNISPVPAPVDSVQKLNGPTNHSLHSLGSINPRQHVIGSNVTGVDSVANPHVTSAQMSLLPPYTHSPNSSVSKDSSASSYCQQTSSNNFHGITHTERVVKIEMDPNLDVPLSSNCAAPSKKSSSNNNNTGHVPGDKDTKKVKRSRRTKWPAIIKDGKFICCRCYREFKSPKSLGGHLSKRAYCKPFDDADLTSDLPSSFLDLLNSPHPTPSSYVNLQLPVHPPVKGPLDPKLFPNVTYPQANGSIRTNSEKQIEEVFKQSTSNLCVSSGQEKQTLPDTGGVYTQSSRMSETSVIQHTDSVKHQPQASYLEMSNTLFNDGLSDPLLSQLLAEDHSPSTKSGGSSDHVTPQLFQTEAINKNSEIDEKPSVINSSRLSNDGLLAAMASLAHNLASEKSVKERLREQILAGDLHRKSSSPHESSVESFCSQMSTASPLTGDMQHSSNLPTVTQNEQQVLENSDATSAETVLQLGDVILNEGTASSGPAVNGQFDEMSEIQKAFEKLDLDREVIEDSSTDKGPTVSDEKPNTPVEPICLPTELPVYVKPFGCDTKGCTYRAMTKDALFKHLIKIHNYTDDMLAKLKDHFNVAPFQCQKCCKSFTRNSNLRAHYLTIHNFSQEDLKQMKRQSNPQPIEGSKASPCPVPESLNKVKNMPLSDVGQQQVADAVPSRSLKVEKIRSNGVTPQFVQQSTILPQGKHLATQKQTVSLENPTTAQPSVIVSGHCSFNPKVDPLPHTWFPGQVHLSPLKELRPMPSLPLSPSAPVQIANKSPLDVKPKPCKPRPVKPKELPKKIKEKKVETDDAFSPYRPYRCVHHGCVAAFTIQHNLILHYKAVHQSALPKFEESNQDEQNDDETEENGRNEKSEDMLDSDIKEVDEFRCHVKDCCSIFQSVPDLLQHYLLLHKLTLEKAGAMMCSINLGRFQCDQPDCSETFTGFWKYINHVDAVHKDIKISQVEPVEGLFKCQVEGCECAYSTRSNLLRHTMKKHQDVYKRLLMNPQLGKRGAKLGRPRKYPFDVVEKENRETNKKPIKKVCLKQKKEKNNNNNWTKYGKPILKTKEEASAMCTKRLQLQYACMIKGCETVTGSERNIMKHYLQHGLPKQYLEEQRSNFIYCKKLPRSKYKRIAPRSDDTDKSEESSIEASDNEGAAEPGPSESEFSKPTSEKESTEDADVSDCKPSTDTNSEISVVVKRRRGRPRKGEIVAGRPFGRNRTTRPRNARSCTVNYVDLNSDSTSSSTTVTQEDASDQNTPLNSFKPMGFEVSFLQFLKESRTPNKRKATVEINGSSCKRMTAFHLKTATVVCRRSDAIMPSRDALQLVEFKNPQKLTSLSNVTFEVQKVFSDVFELLLKQLHEMRPTVILDKEN